MVSLPTGRFVATALSMDSQVVGVVTVVVVPATPGSFIDWVSAV
jgi:hypothetical protein